MSLIDDLNPPCDHNKYADDLTLYSMIQINDVELQNSTAHKATVTRIHNNTLQIAADLTSKSCHRVDLTLNVTKSCTITFSL